MASVTSPKTPPRSHFGVFLDDSYIESRFTSEVFRKGSMDCLWRLIAISAVVLPMFVEPGVTLAQGYIYAAPEMTGDGWEVASLESAQIREDLIKDLFNRVLQGDFKNIL